MRWGWWVLGGGLLGGIALALGGGDPSSPAPDKPKDDKRGDDVPRFPKQATQGRKGDPAIEAELDRMQSFLTEHGIHEERMSARELLRLPKATEVDYAIPPDELWPNIIPAATDMLEVRQRMNKPMSWRGYRPPWYNAAVDGSAASAHQEFSAIDARVVDATTEDRRRLGLVTAQVWIARAGASGFGAYGKPNPSDTHLDYPTELWRSIARKKKRRTWRDAQHFIARAQALT